jgi:hypothetical protein
MLRRWCLSCELTLVYRCINRMIRRWGRAGTLAILRALAAE